MRVRARQLAFDLEVANQIQGVSLKAGVTLTEEETEKYFDAEDDRTRADVFKGFESVREVACGPEVDVPQLLPSVPQAAKPGAEESKTPSPAQASEGVPLSQPIGSTPGRRTWLRPLRGLNINPTSARERFSRRRFLRKKERPTGPFNLASRANEFTYTFNLVSRQFAELAGCSCGMRDSRASPRLAGGITQILTSRPA